MIARGPQDDRSFVAQGDNGVDAQGAMDRRPYTERMITSVLERKPILLLPLRSGLYARQDLVEGNTIKQPPIGDNGVDFLSVSDVFERVGA